ncbi:g8853 [Coccomyxa elongata]
MDVGGIIAAIFAAVFNGSFGILSKIKRVQEAQVPPPIFNLWTCIGIIISSLPFLFLHPVFAPLGILSGVFFVLSMASTIFAIQFLGLSTAAGLWSGTAVVVSFTFGVKVLGDTIHKPGLAAPGLMLLIGGIAGIALNGEVVARRHQNEETLRESEEAAAELELGRTNDPLLTTEHAKKKRTRTSLAGLATAIAAGIFGGLVLAPMDFAPEDAKGLAYIPSMAAGVLLAAPLLTLGFVGVGQAPCQLYTKSAALPGILAGIIWNAGNACSIIATTNPNVGLSIAYPIMQAGLLFAGLWGVVLFKELSGREQVGYWLSSVVLIAGVSMLASSK